MTPEDLFKPCGRWGTNPSIADRIEVGVCWDWTGYRDPRGYGHVRVPGNKSYLVHRLIWETLVGPIPEDKELDHLCTNTSCCYPAHLEVVTGIENKRRGPGNQNVRKTHCIHGHPLSGHNLYFYAGPPQRRHCKTCALRRAKEFRERQKANQ